MIQLIIHFIFVFQEGMKKEEDVGQDKYKIACLPIVFLILYFSICVSFTLYRGYFDLELKEIEFKI